MASVAVTNTFASGGLIKSSEVNTNFSDLVTYINNRNAGSAVWEYLYATNASGAVLRINNSTGVNNIAEFQDNGSTVVTIADGGTVTLTGVIALATGAAATPSYTFAGDLDSGMFRSGANDIQIAAGGTAIGKFDSTGVTCVNGQFLAENGTAGAPTFSFTSETTSGMFRVGASDIQISVAGTARAKFSSAGLTCPNGVVLVENGSAAAPAITATSDTNTGLYFDGSDAVYASAGGTGKLKVDTTGVVMLNGQIFFLSASAAAPSIAAASDTDTGIYLAGTNTLGVATAGAIRFAVTGSEVVSYGNNIPDTDNAYSCGKTGARWTELWAANGTVQTSSLSEKTDVSDIADDDIQIPRAIKFRWNAEKEKNMDSPFYLGFAADDLPIDARPLDPVTGERDTKSVYTSSVLAMLCAAVKKIDSRLKAIGA